MIYSFNYNNYIKKFFSYLYAIFFCAIFFIEGGKSMLNQVVLVGRLVKRPELRVTENGKKTSTITLAVPRNYKNLSGEYDTDFLDCTLWTNVAENTSEYCQTGDMVGVKGRIQTRYITAQDGSRKRKTEIVAEKVTFLAQAENNKKHNDDTKK